MKALAWVAGVNLCGRTAWRRTRPLAHRAGCRRTRRQPCAACRPDTGGYRLSAVRDAEPSSAPQLCAPSARSAVARRQRSACTYARGVGLRRTWLSPPYLCRRFDGVLPRYARRTANQISARCKSTPCQRPISPEGPALATPSQPGAAACRRISAGIVTSTVLRSHEFVCQRGKSLCAARIVWRNIPGQRTAHDPQTRAGR
jgi:hypothetical protein